MLPGELTGQGRHTSCEVLARKSAGAASHAYTECSVVGVSDEMPDGVYTVHFDGHQLEVQQRNGIWFPQGEPVPEPTSEPPQAPVPARSIP